MVKIYSEMSWVVNFDFKVKIGDEVRIEATVSDEIVIGNVTDIKEDVIAIESNIFGEVTVRKDIIENISLVQSLSKGVLQV